MHTNVVLVTSGSVDHRGNDLVGALLLISQQNHLLLTYPNFPHQSIRIKFTIANVDILMCDPGPLQALCGIESTR